MSKKDFIALADAIKDHNRASVASGYAPTFTDDHLQTLATFCKRTNSAFMKDRWLDYIAGNCGSNGGRIK